MQINIDIDKVKRNFLFEEKIKNTFETIKQKSDLLFEKYCVYDKQYDDTRRIALSVIDMLKNNELEKKLDFQINGYDIYVTINKNISQVGASIEETNRGIEIEIYLSSIFQSLATFDENAVFTKIESSIAHELSHLNTHANKIKTTGKDEDFDWYKAIINIIFSEKKLTEKEQYFIYGLYYTYYHEYNAYASQVPNEIKWMVTNYEIENPTKEILLHFLKNTQPFKTYSVILENYLTVLKSFSSEDIKSISKLFKPYDENVSNDILNNYKKYVKYIETNAKIAMKKIYRAFNYTLEQYGLL